MLLHKTQFVVFPPLFLLLLLFISNLVISESVHYRVDGNNGDDTNNCEQEFCKTLDHVFELAREKSMESIPELEIQISVHSGGEYPVSKALHITAGHEENGFLSRHWKLMNEVVSNEEEVIIFAESSSPELSSLDGQSALFNVTLSQREGESNAKAFTLELNGVHFRDLSSVLQVNDDNEVNVMQPTEPTVEIIVQNCTFQNMRLILDNVGPVGALFVKGASACHLDIEGSTFSGCHSRGLAIIEGSGHNITLRNVEMTRNQLEIETNEYYGGSAVMIDKVVATNALIENSNFTGNTLDGGEGKGGGVIMFQLKHEMSSMSNGSTFTMRDTTVCNNNHTNSQSAATMLGGGIYFSNENDRATLELIDCTICNNNQNTSGDGGLIYGSGMALYVGPDAVMERITFDSCRFADNVARCEEMHAKSTVSGAGLYLENNGRINGFQVHGNIIKNNVLQSGIHSSSERGGGGFMIANTNTGTIDELRFEKCNVRDNTIHVNVVQGKAFFGGGVFVDNRGTIPQSEFTECNFQNNRIITGTEASGGGIALVDGGGMEYTKFDRCTFKENAVERLPWDNFELDDDDGIVLDQSICRGGGIFIVGVRTTTVTHCNVMSNSVFHGIPHRERGRSSESSFIGEGGGMAVYGGGMIEVLGGTDPSYWANNNASRGGAISVEAVTTLDISSDVRFENNMATSKSSSRGGALFIDTAKYVNLTGVIMVNNRATKGYGGGISMTSVFSGEAEDEQNSNVRSEIVNGAIITSCMFEKNEAGYGGGAIYTFGVTINHVQNSTFKGNRVLYGNSDTQYGGGALRFKGKSIRIEYGSEDEIIPSQSPGTVIRDCHFIENRASGSGAAVHSIDFDVQLKLDNCSFENHRSTADGGTALIVSRYMSLNDLHIQRSTSENGSGGGFSLQGNIVDFSNIIFDDCTASTGGGALHISQETTEMIAAMNVIVRNSKTIAGDGGGILCTEAKCQFISRNALIDTLLLHLDGNQAPNGNGGGFACGNRASCTLAINPKIGVLVENNKAMHGGGVSISWSTLEVGILGGTPGDPPEENKSAWFRKNTATVDGGAFYVNETDSGSMSDESALTLQRYASFDPGMILIEENSAEFGGAIMLNTIRETSMPITEFVYRGVRESIALSSSICRIHNNKATQAGGAFFVKSPANRAGNVPELMPNDWRDHQILEGNSVDEGGYGEIIGTNPVKFEAMFENRSNETYAGEQVVVSITVMDALQQIVHSYPNTGNRVNHPPITIHIASSHPYNSTATTQANELKMVHQGNMDRRSGEKDVDFAEQIISQGDNVTFDFHFAVGLDFVDDPHLLPDLQIEVSMFEQGNAPNIFNNILKNAPNRFDTTSVMSVDTLYDESLPVAIKPCQAGMSAYPRMEHSDILNGSGDKWLWICQSSSCSWFLKYDTFLITSLVTWFVLIVSALAGVVIMAAYTFIVFGRRLRGSLRSWKLRLGIGVVQMLRSIIFLIVGVIVIITVVPLWGDYPFLDLLFSIGYRSDQLDWIIQSRESLFSLRFFMSFPDVLLMVMLLLQLLASIWYAVLLLELSTTGFKWVNRAIISSSSKKPSLASQRDTDSYQLQNSWHAKSILSKMDRRSLLHLIITAFVLLVGFIVFAIGAVPMVTAVPFFKYGDHGVYLLMILSTLAPFFSIIPMGLYLYELLTDKQGAWKQIEVIRDMTPQSLWRYRLKHAAGVVLLWLVLTVAESFVFFLMFNPSRSPALCRPLFMPLLLIPVHLIQCIVMPLVLNAIFNLPDRNSASESRSNDYRGSGNFHNLSQYLLLEERELAEVPTSEMIPPTMIIAPEDLEYGEQIGSGVQGAVFKGTLLSGGGVNVAIKSMVKLDINRTASAHMRGFWREMLTLYEHGNHPNIVRLVGVCEDERKISLVLEYCDGGSLSTLLMRNAGCRARGENLEVPFNDKLRILLDTVSGMCHLHARNLIHRDLKPENVLLSSAGSVLMAKVADLGFVKSNYRAASNMTMNVGTAAYLAPEVLKGAGRSLKVDNTEDLYDERCDVYSFGIMMYTVLGDLEHPYGNLVSDLDIIARMARDPVRFRPPHDESKVPFIRECIDNNHRWYIDLMKQCWNHDPTDRPSFTTVAQTIRSHIS